MNTRIKDTTESFKVISTEMKKLANIYSNLTDKDPIDDLLFEAIELIRKGCLKGRDICQVLKKELERK